MNKTIAVAAIVGCVLFLSIILFRYFPTSSKLSSAASTTTHYSVARNVIKWNIQHPSLELLQSPLPTKTKSVDPSSSSSTFASGDDLEPSNGLLEFFEKKLKERKQLERERRSENNNTNSNNNNNNSNNNSSSKKKKKITRAALQLFGSLRYSAAHLQRLLIYLGYTDLLRFHYDTFFLYDMPPTMQDDDSLARVVDALSVQNIAFLRENREFFRSNPSFVKQEDAICNQYFSKAKEAKLFLSGVRSFNQDRFVCRLYFRRFIINKIRIEYEQLHNVEYDFVVRTRVDVKLLPVDAPVLETFSPLLDPEVSFAGGNNRYFASPDVLGIGTPKTINAEASIVLNDFPPILSVLKRLSRSSNKWNSRDIINRTALDLLLNFTRDASTAQMLLVFFTGSTIELGFWVVMPELNLLYHMHSVSGCVIEKLTSGSHVVALDERYRRGKDRNQVGNGYIPSKLEELWNKIVDGMSSGGSSSSGGGGSEIVQRDLCTYLNVMSDNNDNNDNNNSNTREKTIIPQLFDPLDNNNNNNKKKRWKDNLVNENMSAGEYYYRAVKEEYQRNGIMFHKEKSDQHWYFSKLVLWDTINWLRPIIVPSDPVGGLLTGCFNNSNCRKSLLVSASCRGIINSSSSSSSLSFNPFSVVSTISQFVADMNRPKLARISIAERQFAALAEQYRYNILLLDVNAANPSNNMQRVAAFFKEKLNLMMFRIIAFLNSNDRFDAIDRHYKSQWRSRVSTKLFGTKSEKSRADAFFNTIRQWIEGRDYVFVLLDCDSRTPSPTKLFPGEVVHILDGILARNDVVDKIDAILVNGCLIDSPRFVGDMTKRVAAFFKRNVRIWLT